MAILIGPEEMKSIIAAGTVTLALISPVEAMGQPNRPEIAALFSCSCIASAFDQEESSRLLLQGRRLALSFGWSEGDINFEAGFQFGIVHAFNPTSKQAKAMYQERNCAFLGR